MLVLLAIAIIVLLSSVAWFLLGFGGTARTQTETQQFRDCCSKYVTATNCNEDPAVWPTTGVCGFDDKSGDGQQAIDGSEPSWTLGALGNRIGVSPANVKRSCGCPGTGGGSEPVIPT